MAFVYIVPIHCSDVANTEFPPLAAKLTQTFGISVKLQSLSLSPDFAYDPSRNQYHSTLILERLLEERPPDAHRILGITDLDLFIPILTFVFGEAQLNGPAAVVSSHRLRNEFYGLPPDEELLQQRLAKEAIHEMGHTFDLVHCANYGCVMQSSTYVEDIDLKTDQFCPSCLETLRAKMSLAF